MKNQTHCPDGRMYVMQNILSSFNRLPQPLLPALRILKDSFILCAFTHTNNTKSHIISGVSKEKPGF